MEFLTKKVKDIIGIDDIDLDIDPDDDKLQYKLEATEKTLEEFDATIDRLCSIVDSYELPKDDDEEEEEEEEKEYEPEDKDMLKEEEKPEKKQDIPKEDAKLPADDLEAGMMEEGTKNNEDEYQDEPSDVEDA